MDVAFDPTRFSRVVLFAVLLPVAQECEFIVCKMDANILSS